MIVLENGIISRLETLLDKLRIFINESEWKSKYAVQIEHLQNEMNEPCVLAVAGKVKAGKSYLINALLGVDLAMTGTTETTATINVFKRGTPPIKEKPVLCQWMDGRKEWMPKSFLESLQGTDEDTLAKTAKIDKLIFYLEDNPMLDMVILVDTPGIGAVVGDDDDAHQVHTDAYFQLRERHKQDTISLSNSADAVLYLFTVVPEEIDKDFLLSLYDNGRGLTALNGIGVLSKVDKNDAILFDPSITEHFTADFQRELFKVLPVSAGIYKNIPSEETAFKIQRLFREKVSNTKIFDYLISSNKAYLKETVNGCAITLDERISILKELLNVKSLQEDYPWRVFSVILKELYYSEDVHQSLEYIRKLSGIEPLKELVLNHFFSRSKLLRASKILAVVKKMLLDLCYDEVFLSMEEASDIREKCRSECLKIDKAYRKIFEELIEKYLPTTLSLKESKKQIDDFIIEVESMLEELKEENDNYTALQLMNMNSHLFKEEEIQELNQVIVGKIVEREAVARLKYWSYVSVSSAPNSVRQIVALCAKRNYLKAI